MEGNSLTSKFDNELILKQYFSSDHSKSESYAIQHFKTIKVPHFKTNKVPHFKTIKVPVAADTKEPE